MALLPAFVLVGLFVVTHHYLYVNAFVEHLLELAVMLALGAFFAWWRQSRVDGRLLLAAEHRGLEMLLQLGLMAANCLSQQHLFRLRESAVSLAGVRLLAVSGRQLAVGGPSGASGAVSQNR